MFEILRRMWLDDEGQDLAEYGLLTALIAVAVVLGVTAFGGDLNTFFTGLSARVGLPGA
jgi:pilus assembly protein Flp/PilA